MPPTPAHRALLGAALLSLAVAACGADGERRVVLLRYSQAAARVVPLQEAFVSAWQASQRMPDMEALQRAGREEVLPALAAYVSGLAALPASGALGELHDGLVLAWRHFETRLAGYYERVTAANFPKRNRRLESDWVDLGARIVAYRAALGAHYAELGLALQDSPEGGP